MKEMIIASSVHRKCPQKTWPQSSMARNAHDKVNEKGVEHEIIITNQKVSVDNRWGTHHHIIPGNYMKC